MRSVEVKQVASKQDLERFIRLPHSLYQQDRAWVAPLLHELRQRLSADSNPYFEHAQVALFLATVGDRVVGRISAQVCDLVQEYQGEGLGHFGFFESENDPQVARALVEAAEAWLRDKGMNRVQGPFDLGINEEVGLLVDGFERPPFVMMGHHMPYYQDLLEGMGYQKEMDLLTYYRDIREPYPDRIRRVVDCALRSQSLKINPVQPGQLAFELRRILDVFREAWADNWGYVPPTDAEFEKLKDQFRPLLMRGTIMKAEIDEELAGFMVVIPNLNELISDMGGRLFPFAWAKLLWRLKFAPFKTVRVPLMGVRKKYHGTRLGPAIAFAMIDQCREKFLPMGVTHCEMSWILESNAPMRGILEGAGLAGDKCYRVYGKKL